MWKARVAELPGSLRANRRSVRLKSLRGTARLPNVNQG
jgi:hypothetical protein